MRRKYFGLALAAIAAVGSTGVWQSTGLAGDREIAEQIIEKLREGRDSGQLKDFTLDMKVDEGVVVFRGNVAADVQKRLVLGSADGIDGIAKVVDEVTVTNTAPAVTVVRPKAQIAKADEGFSFREALARTAASLRKQEDTQQEPSGDDQQADTPETIAEVKIPELFPSPTIASNDFALPDFALPEIASDEIESPETVPGEIMRTAAAEPMNVQPAQASLTDAIIATLGEAQRRGELKGFGVDVADTDGVIELTGKARSAAQRDLIVQLVEGTPGVKSVRPAIEIIAAPVQPVANLQQMNLQPASSRGPSAPVMNTPYRMNQGAPMQAAPASNMMGSPAGAPVMGQPVPMGGYQGAAAPRYDQPYLPNYAWPGYAAYPNYAAVTYPQQYSPSAFPYIGPFYPYPQVPLGWRKVSLEWDDGWWYLDFTDR